MPPEAYHEEWHTALAEFVDPWIAKGREQERAAIVTWLQTEGQDHYAALIEFGHHLRGDDE